MTVIATASNPRFWVSRVDIDRDGPTYTIDTLRDLRTRAARRRPVLHHRRRRPRRDLHLARRRRAVRPRALRRLHPARLRHGRPTLDGMPGGQGHDPGDPRAGHLLDRLPRRGTQRGEPVWYLVPDGVVQYISKYALYAPEPPDDKARNPLHDRHRPRPRAGPRRRPGGLGQARREHHRLRRVASSSSSPTRSCSLGPQRPPGQGDRRRDRGPAARRSAPSRYAARASATAAGCSSTTPRSSCTSSTRRSGRSTPSSGSGATAR